MSNEITVRHDAGKRAFLAELDGQQVGEMTYKGEPPRIVIVHTKVEDVVKGRGVGKQLVAAAVDWARAEKISVRATCPFARAVFEKTPEYQDVYAK